MGKWFEFDYKAYDDINKKHFYVNYAVGFVSERYALNCCG